MSRASAFIGLLCGIVSLGGGVLGYVRADSTASLVTGAVAGVVLVVTAGLTLRRSAWAQVVMSVVGLALLARFLPAYFKTYSVWPALVLVALGSFTFGFGMLGFILDRYRYKEHGPVAGGGGER
jgi:uncharacterized membrane protein (UPF0136 family)